MDNHLKKGRQAEQQACEHLRKKGLKLVQKNYRCTSGEIDLIMKDKEMLVFVEVRYRKDIHFGSGAETVNSQKQKKLISAALHYLQRHSSSKQSCRFDVISTTNENRTEDLQWIQDAFQT